MDRILKAVQGARFQVTDVKNGERAKKAPLPFTTSTLQQEASKVLNFSTSKTMRLAQQLYEGIDVEGQGTVGIITYLRIRPVSRKRRNRWRSLTSGKLTGKNTWG